jgi:hypothetical protein
MAPLSPGRSRGNLRGAGLLLPLSLQAASEHKEFVFALSPGGAGPFNFELGASLRRIAAADQETER